VAHQPPSDPQAHGVLRPVGRSVSFGVGGLTEGVQDQARDLRGVDRIEEAVARQQHVVLVARQPGGGAVGFSRHVGLLVKVPWGGRSVLMRGTFKRLSI